MRYHFTLVRRAIITNSTNKKFWRGCGEKATLLHCWWKCKLIQPLWKTVWRFLSKLKTELPCDVATPLLGIYPEKNIIKRIHLPQCSLQSCSSSKAKMSADFVIAWRQHRMRDACGHAKSLQLCLTVWTPVNCSLPGSGIHGIPKARILEWVAMSSSRGSSRPRGWHWVSCSSCIVARFFTAEPLGKP